MAENEMPQNRRTPYKTKGKGDFWATWALPFAIAFEDYLFVVYHFRYPQMAENELPQNQPNPYKTKGKGDFWPLGAFRVSHFRYLPNGPFSL